MTEEDETAPPPMIGPLVPEFAVTDYQCSIDFYCDILGFQIAFDRLDEAFAFLTFGAAQLMIYEIGRERVLSISGAALERPFGRGVNLQIQVQDAAAQAKRLQTAGVEIVLPLEERWYRANLRELGVRQYAVSDPDGYFLRFSESLGHRRIEGDRASDPGSGRQTA